MPATRFRRPADREQGSERHPDPARGRRVQCRDRTAAITTTTQTGKGVIFDFARGLRKMEGSTILAADRQLLLSALNSAGVELTPPQVDDIATIGGTDYTIHRSLPAQPWWDWRSSTT
jgi:hypothetical protein